MLHAPHPQWRHVHHHCNCQAIASRQHRFRLHNPLQRPALHLRRLRHHYSPLRSLRRLLLRLHQPQLLHLLLVCLRALHRLRLTCPRPAIWQLAHQQHTCRMQAVLRRQLVASCSNSRHRTAQQHSVPHQNHQLQCHRQGTRQPLQVVHPLLAVHKVRVPLHKVKVRLCQLRTPEPVMRLAPQRRRQATIVHRRWLARCSHQCMNARRHRAF